MTTLYKYDKCKKDEKSCSSEDSLVASISTRSRIWNDSAAEDDFLFPTAYRAFDILVTAFSCTMAKYEVYEPNEGHSVDAAQTMRRSESQDAFRKRFSIDTSTQIRLVKVSHMVYQHSDIDSIVVFLHGESARSHRLVAVVQETCQSTIRLPGDKANPNRFRYANCEADGKQDLVQGLWS